MIVGYDVSKMGWKCPECGENYFTESCGMTTLLYYQPIYRNGKNINPDRNNTTWTRYCKGCDTNWLIKGNDYDGHEVHKLKPANKEEE